MIDPNRLNRVHVVDVKLRNRNFYVYLSDGSDILWDVWIMFSEADRRRW